MNALILGMLAVLHHAHANPVKRCANLFSEGCVIGDGQGQDGEWLGGGPGRRSLQERMNLRGNCANMHGENCINGGVIGSGKDKEWLENGPGKRNLGQDGEWLANGPGRRSLQERCLNMHGENCINGGVIGSGNDKHWLENGPGRRDLGQDGEWLANGPGRRSLQERCLNMHGENCINGGVIGSGQDKEWLENGPGKRNLGQDGGWLANGPGRRNLQGNGKDKEWLEDGPGRRDLGQDYFMQTLEELFQRVQAVVSKRCANLHDPACTLPPYSGWGGPEPGKRQ